MVAGVALVFVSKEMRMLLITLSLVIVSVDIMICDNRSSSVTEVSAPKP